MPTALEEMDQTLAMTAQVVISEFTEEARAEMADLDQFPLVQIVEVLDDRTCELCEYMDGMWLRRDSPDFERWARSPHINCRRTLHYVSGPGLEADFVPPPDELVEKHGHFIRDPDKYAPLRILAQPEGRDFVFVRVKDPETGEMVSVMRWRTQIYDIPGLTPETIHLAPMGGGAEGWYPSRRMEHALRRNRPHVISDLANGVTRARRATVGEYDVCYKPDPGPDSEFRHVWNPPNEEAAYLVDQGLGLNLVPPTVARETAKGEWTASVQIWDETGEQAAHLAQAIEDEEDEDGSLAERLGLSRQSRDAGKMFWFDGLIGNHDRNWGNILVDMTRPLDEEQRLIAIDHGLTFFPPDFYATAPRWVRDEEELRQLRDRLVVLLVDEELGQRLRYLLDENPTDAMRHLAEVLGASRYGVFRETVQLNIDLINDWLNQFESGTL